MLQNVSRISLEFIKRRGYFLLWNPIRCLFHHADVCNSLLVGKICCWHREGMEVNPACMCGMQISVVVYAFKYPVRTALAVGLSMAQIGEFAFVLLSVASQLGLLPYQVYMLLMGAPQLTLPQKYTALYAVSGMLELHAPGCPAATRKGMTCFCEMGSRQ